MKKTLKILGITLLAIIVIIIILPFAFKGKIEEKVKEEVNNSLNAKVDWTGYGLSLFRSFPDFSVKLKGLTVVGIEEFEKDTLLNMKTFYASINLMSVFSGNYEVKTIKLDEPKILYKILEDGKSNVDIVKETEGEAVDTTEIVSEEPSAFKLTLKKFVIKNADIIYDDREGEMFVDMHDFNFSLKGDLSEDFTSLYTKTEIAQMTFIYDGIKYFNKANVELNADFDGDLVHSKYTFKENELRINQLFLGFDGFFVMPEEGYEMDLTFFTKKTEFKSFLSLVPAVYSKDFEDIEAQGKLALNGLIKGTYNEVLYPTINLDIVVEKGMFKYPDLPKSVDNIEINTNVSNPGGSLDKMIVDIKKFHIEMAENPVDIKMLIVTSEEDVTLDGNIKGKMDLAQVKDFYPLAEGEDLSGVFKVDLNTKGNLSSIENEKYEEFEADGNLNIKGMNYKSEDFPQGILISNAEMNFSPKYLSLVDFQAKFGKSDLTAKGKIDNFLSYWFNDEVLSGNFKVSSDYLNLNEFIEDDEQTGTPAETPASETESAMTVFEVPDNIDFSLTAVVGKLIYDNMEMTSVYGKVLIKDAAVVLENLNMNMLNGKLTVDGSYGTQDPQNPDVDFGLNINKFDIQKSYKTFGTMKKLVPIAEKTFGSFSAKMKLKMTLDKEMMPVMNSVSGNGSIFTSPMVIKNAKMFSKLADELKMSQFKELKLDKAEISFIITDGNVVVKPFDVKLGNINANISGSSNLDQSINYVMKFDIPKDEFGGAANNVLNGLLSSANAKGLNISIKDVVTVNALVTGTVTDPKVKIFMGEVTESVIEDLKDKVIEEVKEKVEEVIDKAKEDAIRIAEEKAKQLMDEANKRAEQIIGETEKQADKIRNNGKIVADKVRAEAEIAAKKIENEAKGQIKLLRNAAKKLADKGREEGENKAKKIENEANKKADQLVAKARKETDAIRKKAKDEGDKLIEKAKNS